VVWGNELNANVRSFELHLSTVRYGTVTEKNAPVI
jgi:hypothetical protein